MAMSTVFLSPAIGADGLLAEVVGDAVAESNRVIDADGDFLGMCR